MRNRGAVVLGMLAATLAGIVVLEYHAARLENEKLPLSTRGQPSAAAPGTPPPAADDLPTRLADILGRPLFAATRRPPPGAAAAPAAAGAALPRLTGVMVGSGGRRVIFAGDGDGKPVVLGEGGRIGAWRVQSIGDGQATVVGPDGTRVLRPTYAASTAAQNPAAPTAPSIIDLLRSGSRSAIGVPGLPIPPAAPAAQ